MTELTDFRKLKDETFAQDPDSPLADEQKRGFQGLIYFPENPALRLEVQVERFAQKETIKMLTSSGDVQTYTRYGRFTVTVDGQSAELTIYTSHGGYFLPFVDSLAGKETYPAGRYLEPESLHNGRFLVDFNLAYNPTCAYNDGWSCPITPTENRIKIPIQAGEKLFHPEE